MELETNAAAAVRVPPPLLYLGAILAGWLLHAYALPFPLPFTAVLRAATGTATALAGVTMMAGAIGLFRQSGQDPKPWKETPEIISTGVYKWSRNPMYVGMALLQLGLGLGLANGWMIALVPVVLLLVYGTAVRHEEAYLERKFGETYLAYKCSVRRWL